ncbi:hypothetical protein EDC96DRAFT_600792 [Choanephora cucurbitarum]|nr:hypothetical protein EDC96DRAFT_600792 [Choanephora cucurbitarum]
MVILPGAKTVRICNTLDNASPANTCQPIKSQEEAQLSSSASIPTSSLAPNTNLSKTEANRLQHEITQVSNQLKQACKARGDFILRNKIKELKEQWVLQDKTILNKTLREKANRALTSNQDLYEQITQIRRNRKQLDEDIYIQRNKLEKLRHDAYFLRNSKGQQPVQTSTKMITSEEYKCFENVDNVTIDGSILEKQDEVRFFGTDNGIVSISETAPFSLRKLRYHLQLYDTYKTPTSTNRICIFEAVVMLFNTVCNVQKLLQKVKKYKQRRKFSHNTHFYYSPARNRSKKRYEMRQEKACDRTCSAERSTSQICVFRFKKIIHPLRIVKKDGRESLKTIIGTSICNNKACVLNSAKQSHKPRDTLSALAIGISGASRLIGKGTLDVFNRSRTRLTADGACVPFRTICHSCSFSKGIKGKFIWQKGLRTTAYSLRLEAQILLLINGVLQ